MRKPKRQPAPRPSSFETKGTYPEPVDVKPDYTRKCIVCGATPVLGATGMCGPCAFGESETADGNW